MSKKDGGTAFPVVAENGLGHVSEGMTMRQWYAGLAMQGILANPKSFHFSNEELADCAFEIADAMIAEDEREND